LHIHATTKKQSSISVGGVHAFFLLLLELGYPFALAKTIKKEHGKEGTK
jgi:hypothetical protein